jgi:hypothetical protein
LSPAIGIKCPSSFDSLLVVVGAIAVVDSTLVPIGAIALVEVSATTPAYVPTILKNIHPRIVSKTDLKLCAYVFTFTVLQRL